jgi:phage tail sheath gpL-like
LAQVDAEATLTFSGTATESGTLRIAVQSERFFTFEVGVASGADAVTVVAPLVAQVIDNNDEILVDAIEAAGSVTLNAVHPGTDGNFLKIRLVSSVPGIDVAITPFSGGAGAVDLLDFAAIIGDRRYQTILIPSSYSANLTALRDYLDSVYNTPNRIKDGVGVTVYSATSTTDAATLSQTTLGSRSMIVLTDKIVATADQKGGCVVEYNNTLGAQFAADRALRLTDGANIASIITGPNISNTSGGPFRAALPYHQTPFYDVARIVKSRGWSQAEQQILLNNNVSFFGNDITDSRITIGDVTTTYNEPDQVFKYLNTVDTTSVIREFFFNNCQARYAQTVLTDGALSGPNPIANEQSIAAFLVGLYQILAGSNFGLCQAGSSAQKFFNDNLQVEVLLSTGTVNISAVVPIVSQLRIINGTIELSFNI